MHLDEWLRCRGWLLAALEPGCGGEGMLVADLLSGRAQLWAGKGSALVTQWIGTSTDRSLHVWLAGGNLREILSLRLGVEAWARAHGCKRITLNGRPGWTRALRAAGYSQVGDELERRL